MVSHREQFQVEYDMMNNPKYRSQYIDQRGRAPEELGGNVEAWHRIANLEDVDGVEDQDLRLNGPAYADINERYNRSFVMLKNAVDNYRINL